MKSAQRILIVGILAAALLTIPAFAQTSELPRYTEAYSWSSGRLSGESLGAHTEGTHHLAKADMIFVPGAQWLRLNFNSAGLGDASYIESAPAWVTRATSSSPPSSTVAPSASTPTPSVIGTTAAPTSTVTLSRSSSSSALATKTSTLTSGKSRSVNGPSGPRASVAALTTAHPPTSPASAASCPSAAPVGSPTTAST
jgi:hypothetical protein